MGSGHGGGGGGAEMPLGRIVTSNVVFEKLFELILKKNMHIFFIDFIIAYLITKPQ